MDQFQFNTRSGQVKNEVYQFVPPKNQEPLQEKVLICRGPLFVKPLAKCLELDF